MREALERGRREGEAAAYAAFERSRAEDATRAAEGRAADRAAWAEAEAARLADALETAIDRVEADLSERIARTLIPALDAALRARALAELEDLMVPLLAREDRPVFKISGPADLIDRLRMRLGDPPACLFEPAEAPDVQVVIGETVLETRLADWAERLRQSVV
ncbi:hypothetical protein [Aquabacter spiritensis]|uniref:hypothetical protein n=1 Tax=Aquabacter spiritensis TaxID=933073 RepID=UPI001043068D|nr:hypothetical protein [Aquabacter spiritensis]